MKIQFIGAAKTVTGSLHYIEANGSKFILDCGLYQGKRKVAFELNRSFDFFDPADIDFVILSHAHIDHSGNLPSLYKKGFRGNIYSTFATRDLCSIMLRDSAHIQEKDTEFVNKRRAKKGQNLFEPLYSMEDAVGVLKLFVGVNYHHEFSPAEGITFSFTDAGHILGSASVFISINEDGKIINLGFTGDLGRPNLPILKDPEKIPDVDLFICESTYGGRIHEDHTLTEKRLAELIQRTAEKRSKIIIPAFSVGRTQELVFAIHNIFRDRLSERIPVFVDSPLSTNATEVFRLHPECFDNETAEYLLEDLDPFGFNQLQYIKLVDESKELTGMQGPHIIISSSGMCEAGRILHHLRNNVEDPRNTILLVGYAAVNTLARKLAEGEKVIKIFGEEFNVNAEVIEMHSFSAHADVNELSAYLSQFDKDRIQNFFIVHGDPEQQEQLKERLSTEGLQNITIPERGSIYDF